MKLQIQEIAQIMIGYQARKAVDYEEDGTHLLLQIRDFNESRTRINPDTMIRFTPNSATPDHILKTGDVVFLSRGQKNFAFAISELPRPTLAGSYFFVLRPEPTVSGPYLAWWLNQPAPQRHFKRLASTGAHMPVVTRDAIERLKVPVPDLETQRKIIEFSNVAATQAELLIELANKKRTLADAACRQAAGAQ